MNFEVSSAIGIAWGSLDSGRRMRRQSNARSKAPQALSLALRAGPSPKQHGGGTRARFARGTTVAIERGTESEQPKACLSERGSHRGATLKDADIRNADTGVR